MDVSLCSSKQKILDVFAQNALTLHGGQGYACCFEVDFVGIRKSCCFEINPADIRKSYTIWETTTFHTSSAARQILCTKLINAKQTLDKGVTVGSCCVFLPVKNPPNLGINFFQLWESGVWALSYPCSLRNKKRQGLKHTVPESWGSKQVAKVWKQAKLKVQHTEFSGRNPYPNLSKNRILSSITDLKLG